MLGNRKIQAVGAITIASLSFAIGCGGKDDGLAKPDLIKQGDAIVKIWRRPKDTS